MAKNSRIGVGRNAPLFDTENESESPPKNQKRVRKPLAKAHGIKKRRRVKRS